MRLSLRIRNTGWSRSGSSFSSISSRVLSRRNGPEPEPEAEQGSSAAVHAADNINSKNDNDADTDDHDLGEAIAHPHASPAS